MVQGVHTVIVDEVHTLARDKRGATWPCPSSVWTTWSRPRGAGFSASGSRPPSDRWTWWRACCPASTRPAPPHVSSTAGTGATSTWPSSSPTASSKRWPAAASSRTCSTGSPPTWLEHRTTLVFVNTRKMAERVAHQLALRLGRPEGDPGRPRPARGPGRPGRCRPQVAAHHGSLSRARRRSSSSGCGPVTSGPWWPRHHSSWASTWVPWSWSARSARPGPSAPSCSGWAGPTTSSRAPRPGGSTR